MSIILQQTAVIAALAIGQTLIILTAGIDLSVGAISILSMLVMANLAANNGVPGLPGAADRRRVGTLCGLLNGVLVTRLEPATVHRHAGHAEHLHRDRPALLRRREHRPAGHAAAAELDGHTDPDRRRSGSPSACSFVVLLAVVVAFALSQTAWGRHVYAVGDDIEAARLAGIRVDRVLLSVYIVAGLIYGLTAWVLIGRAGTASPNAIVDANLETITAVVIGGTSLFGGRGGIIGTMLGALIVVRVQHRSQPGRRGRPVARAGHRCADHRGRLDRPVDPEGEGMTTPRRPATCPRRTSTVGLGRHAILADPARPSCRPAA